MSATFPRIYRSFDEFERDELRKLDSLHTTVDDLTQEQFAQELDFEAELGSRKARGYRGWK